MPRRSSPKISDWVSQLGLRDLFPPQRRQHHDACPQVDKLREDIKHIVETYFVLPIEDIKDSMEIRDAAGALLDKYGAIIWSDADNRPWLFDPGQGAVGARYERHLRYSDSADYEYIEKTLYGYVLARVLRWHKDNYRSSSKGPNDPRLSGTPDNTPDGSYMPFVPARARVSTGGDSQNLRCVAGSRTDHLDATRLGELGVWLGDFNDAYTCVNGLSQWDVVKGYYDSTLGGVDCNNAEPLVLSDLPNKATSCAETVVCAACKDDPDSQLLQLQTRKFELTQEDDAELEDDAEMRMHAWVFCCTFKGKDVFAFVKELPARECQKLGFSSSKLWSFWKVDGGYTTKVLLVNAGQDTAFPILRSDLPGASTKRKRSAFGVEDGVPGPSTTIRGQTKQSEAFLRNHRAQQTDALKITQMASLNESARKRFAFQPINTPSNAGAPLSGVKPDVPLTLPARGRVSSFNSLYDVTPAPGSKKTQASDNAASSTSPESHLVGSSQLALNTFQMTAERLNATPIEGFAANKLLARTALVIDLSSNSSGSRSTSTSHAHARPTMEAPSSAVAPVERVNTSMPPPPLRVIQFKIWFPLNINGTAEVATKAVRFNTAMSFEEAFAHAKSKLERQLGGRELIGMTIDSKVEGKPSLLVDEEDMWGEVIDMVKETGSEELTGTVDME